MANTPKKVAVIGLDCAITPLIEKHIKEGHLPTFKKLFDSGIVADNCLCPYPTITPPNWASIATGAWPGTHCVTDFHHHTPGTTPDNTKIGQSFSSERVKAEFIWDVADRAGKKCIVFNYPGSWPSHMKNGIVVGGGGLSVGEWRDGIHFMDGQYSFCGEQLIATGIFPHGIKGAFKPAKGWSNLPSKEAEPLEIEAKMAFNDAVRAPADTTWYVLARQTGNKGYDRASLSPTRNFKDAFCTLAVGEWSPNIATKIKMPDGKQANASFRCKLIELSEEGEDLRLYISALATDEGWSSPAEIAKELHSEKGIIGHKGGVGGYRYEWYDMDTLVEIMDLYTLWMADAVSTLLSKHEWDLLFMHAHAPDWAYHVLLTDMNLDPVKDKQKYDAAWDAHLKIYESQDRMLEQILKNTDKDTLVILVSDHGAVSDGALYSPVAPLVDAGLTARVQDMGSIDSPARHGQTGKLIASMILTPDPKKSQALPERTVYVYVNLKGRDPEGIVEPEDYEKVQRQICDALLAYVDPVTGKRPVSLALTKKDARILGLYGDAMGDVVYAIYPEFSGQHGNILPAAEWGYGSLKTLLSFTGLGIKKGQRLERTCHLVDIVPTICYLMGLPLPAQAEGGIIYQVFKDPNFLPQELDKLKAGLARMETALQRGERQPWDKHECA
jgi:predicted AlkP superfamily phosphohydrolase/phosphomutase